MKLRYLRKWSRMPWWSQMHLLKQRNKLVHDELYQLIAPHLGNMEELRERYERNPKNNEKGRENDYFVKRFLKKFPEFKYAEIGDIEAVDARSSNIGRLVQHFKALVKKGMSEDAAFQMIQDNYKEHIESKRRNLSVANNLKVSNKARSVMDIYQQRAEYEARMKVERIKRDLDMKEFVEKEDVPDYTRHVKIVNKRGNTKGQQYERETFTELTGEYFDRAKDLLNHYYSNAYVRDRLANLSDDMIMYSIKETPGRIKKRSKKLLKKLDSYNVTLGQDGEPDFSECTNENFKNRFANNPWVKYALVQREMDYSFPHHEHQRAKANETRKNVLYTRSLFRNKLEEMKVEDEEQAKKEVIQTTLEKEMGFNPTDGTKLHDRSGDGEFKASALNKEGIIHGDSYRLDKRDSLLESFDERIIRLEKKWFGERMSSLDAGIEQFSEEELRQKNQELVDRIRRIKLKLEQEAIKKGKDRLFEEHKILTEDEIMTESVPLERLINYYKLPKDERQSNPRDDYEFVKSLRYVKRPELVEDIYDPENMADSQLSVDDTTYFDKFRAEELEKTAQLRMEQDEYELFKQEETKKDMEFQNPGRSKAKVSEKSENRNENEMLIKFIKQKLSNK